MNRNTVKLTVAVPSGVSREINLYCFLDIVITTTPVSQSVYCVYMCLMCMDGYDTNVFIYIVIINTCDIILLMSIYQIIMLLFCVPYII